MTTHSQNTQTLMEKILSLPPQRITEVEDFVDFLRDRAKQGQPTVTGKIPLDFPVDNLGPWPERLSLHRRDIYGDEGR